MAGAYAESDSTSLREIVPFLNALEHRRHIFSIFVRLALCACQLRRDFSEVDSRTFSSIHFSCDFLYVSVVSKLRTLIKTAIADSRRKKVRFELLRLLQRVRGVNPVKLIERDEL